MEIVYNEQYGVWVSRDGKVFKEAAYSERGGNALTTRYLCVSHNRMRIDVHRLVALTFLDNPDNKPCVCHKDDNPTNNSVDNLFWGTHKENMQDMIKKRRGKHMRGLFDKTKIKFEKIMEMLSSGMKQRDIAKELGVKESAISQDISRMRKWGYLPEKK